MPLEIITVRQLRLLLLGTTRMRKNVAMIIGITLHRGLLSRLEAVIQSD